MRRDSHKPLLVLCLFRSIDAFKGWTWTQAICVNSSAIALSNINHMDKDARLTRNHLLTMLMATDPFFFSCIHLIVSALTLFRPKQNKTINKFAKYFKNSFSGWGHTYTSIHFNSVIIFRNKTFIFNFPIVFIPKIHAANDNKHPYLLFMLAEGFMLLKLVPSIPKTKIQSGIVIKYCMNVTTFQIDFPK